MRPEMRRFGFCFLVSLLVNAAALVLAAWVWRPLPLPAAVPFLRPVRLAWRPVRAAPPLVPPPPPLVRTIPRPRPLRPPPPKKRHRPGTRVRSTQPAPPDAPSGGREAGAPAPALVAPPAVHIVTQKRPAPRLAQNAPAPPVVIPAPIAAASASAPVPPPPLPVALPPAPATGHGAGGGSAGKGTASGEGTGKGNGTGAGRSRDAGEPFGIGKGMAGDGAPRHIVYVLDISGSMTSRIDRAEAELRRALRGLRPGETFNIVVFSDEARSFDTGMAPATPPLVRQASAFLDTLQADGGTNLEAAMAKALALPEVNEVILLTDGVPTGADGPYAKEEFPRIAREISRFNRQHARISTIGLVGVSPDGLDQSFEAARLLEQIAHDSGGTSKLVTLGVADP